MARIGFTLSLTTVSNDHNELTWPYNGYNWKLFHKNRTRYGDRKKEKQKKCKKNT